MLEQKRVKSNFYTILMDEEYVALNVDYKIDETEKIEFQESSIDPEKKLYLITWCPDPKELPDTDFYIQHNVNISLLATFLQCCACGVFCVEATQMGNPHYHGWYQVDDEKEIGRVAIVKVMQRFGIVKGATANNYKEFSWKEQGNSLYYYKKDFFTFKNQLPNPIFAESVSTVNFDVLDLAGFFAKSKNSSKLSEQISSRQFYSKFYEDTLSTLY